MFAKLNELTLHFRGAGQNCTKTKLHEETKLHKNKTARRQFCTKGQFCTSYIFARE